MGPTFKKHPPSEKGKEKSNMDRDEMTKLGDVFKDYPNHLVGLTKRIIDLDVPLSLKQRWIETFREQTDILTEAMNRCDAGKEMTKAEFVGLLGQTRRRMMPIASQIDAFV